MNEVDVIKCIYDATKSGIIEEFDRNDIYLDYHPSLSSLFAGRSVQRFSLPLSGFTVHPDIVGRMPDGDSLYAIEAKGFRDSLKGIAQAEIYQFGFHASYFALPAEGLSPVIVDLAKRKNVGLIIADQDCEIVHNPVLTSPQKYLSDKLRRQFDAAISSSSAVGFLYNLPTHYLFWTAVMENNCAYTKNEMKSMYVDFGAEKGKFVGAASGAVRLGLIHRNGNTYRLTEMGHSVHMSLGLTLQQWRELHEGVKKDLLVNVSPQVAGTLRMLMLFDEKLNLIINGIKRLDAGISVEYLDIVRQCDALDHDTALVYFFVPHSAQDIFKRGYEIDWSRVDNSHLRPSVNYQTKSLLQHAGFIRRSNLNSSIWNI